MPHPQMALVQALLVRALVARYWDDPDTEPLVRWGTSLHEDFLLPQGVLRDLDAVVADLHAHDLPFERSWLDPFVEFRFPRIGVVEVPTTSGTVEVELRQAIEPWRQLWRRGSMWFSRATCSRARIMVATAAASIFESVER